MEIYLIRHTPVNVKEGIFYGQSDVDPSNTFEKEAEEIKTKLNPQKNMIFYSSPLKRCLLLAKKLSPTDPIIDPQLKELNFGGWELKRWDEVDQVLLKKWMDDFVHVNPPNGGESYLDLYKRISEFFLELIKEKQEQIVIVAHAGVIRSIIALVLEMPLNNLFSLEIDYSSISKIIVNFDKENKPFYKIKFMNK